jgi:hypothetical protein
MKKLLIVMLCLFAFNLKAQDIQEVFGSATNKSLDGYITIGYVKNSWGIFAGVPYNEQNIISTKEGTISNKAKYGIIHVLSNRKFMFGIGIQPTDLGNKANAFVGFAPLKSKDMKLWMIGNLVGDKFAAGLGLSYRIK